MNSNDFLIYNSILYRCTQKFYDQQLSHENIGYGQAIFLMMINENEGMTLIDLAKRGSFDKATITKAMNKLENLGYVRFKDNPYDKRSKLIYTTPLAKDVISKIYLIRKEWWDHLNIAQEEHLSYIEKMEKMVERAQNYTDITMNTRFYKIDKFSLNAYPPYFSAKLYTGGCNMKCPFCDQSSLVFLSEDMEEIDENKLFEFLEKRQDTLEGLCITGGEPLINEGLKDMLIKLKQFSYKIKLETNGTFPERLKEIVDLKLVDYISLDIKNDPKHYSKASGVQGISIDAIDQTIHYLLTNVIDYDFKTTIVQELHTKENIENIGKWIQGANKFYLQMFHPSSHCIQSYLQPCLKETVEEYKNILEKYVENVEIRG